MLQEKKVNELSYYGRSITYIFVRLVRVVMRIYFFISYLIIIMKFKFLLLLGLANALVATLCATDVHSIVSHYKINAEQEMLLQDSLPAISTPTQNQILSICLGQSITLAFDGMPLSATTFLEINWYHNDVLVGVGEEITLNNITADAAGNYTAEITRYNSCASITEAYVMYNVLLNENGPDIVPTVPLDEIELVCTGSYFSFTFEANVPIDTYNWIHNGNTISSQANMEILSFGPENQGEYYCTVTATNACGTTEINYLVFSLFSGDSLALMDTPAIQDTTVCLGNDFELTFGSVANVSSYQWYFNDTAIGEGQYLTISNMTDDNEGEYYCEVTGSNGCTTQTEMYLIYNVLVSSGPFIITPEVLGVVDLCVGADFTLVYYPADGGENFEWNYNEALVGTGLLLDLTNLQLDQSGSYFCTATATDNCGTSSLTYEIATLNIVDVVQPVISNIDGVLQVQQDFNSYTWYLDGISMSNDATFELSESGTYAVEVTNELGCTSASDDFYFDGINYLTAGTIRIYPNPFENELNVLSAKTIESITIYNAMGAIAYTAAGPLMATIDLSALSAGVYYVMVTNVEHQLEVLKVIKEN